MPRRFFERLGERIDHWFLALYVWIDVALFMTAERITSALPPERNHHA